MCIFTYIHVVLLYAIKFEVIKVQSANLRYNPNVSIITFAWYRSQQFDSTQINEIETQPRKKKHSKSRHGHRTEYESSDLMILRERGSKSYSEQIIAILEQKKYEWIGDEKGKFCLISHFKKLAISREYSEKSCRRSSKIRRKRTIGGIRLRKNIKIVLVGNPGSLQHQEHQGRAQSTRISIDSKEEESVGRRVNNKIFTIRIRQNWIKQPGGDLFIVCLIE